MVVLSACFGRKCLVSTVSIALNAAVSRISVKKTVRLNFMLWNAVVVTIRHVDTQPSFNNVARTDHFGAISLPKQVQCPVNCRAFACECATQFDTTTV